jgi:thymidylate synthase (FAD)
MPHVANLEPKKHAFTVLFGQRPLTRFKDYKTSIKVDLIKYDDPVSMMRGTYDFCKATWSEDGRESERASEKDLQDALDAMLSGKALGLGLETVNFMFRISGITRLDTHQIVRQRIGVTFSQQCTGDRFLHHNDVLVEECISNDKQSYIAYRDATLATKMSYASMIDNGVSIQAARAITPQNLETFIFMNINLATLIFFYQKRIDDGSQTWAMNEISRQMERAVCEKFPQLQSVFDKAKTKFTFQRDAGKDRKNTFSTSLYVPKVDEYDYNIRDFLYPTTKEAMHYLGNPMPDQYYWGTEHVTKGQYDYVKNAYDDFNKEIHANNWSNEEILSRAITITRSIDEKFDASI